VSTVDNICIDAQLNQFAVFAGPIFELI